MKLTVSSSTLSGSIAVSGSKSHTIRGIIAALCADGKSILHAPLASEDTLATLDAARLLGAEVVCYPDRWEITGTQGKFRNPGARKRLKAAADRFRSFSCRLLFRDF